VQAHETTRIRQTLLELAGPERYARFVIELNRRVDQGQRLLFWQEALWAQVEERLGLSPHDVDAIAAHLRNCPAHAVALQRESVAVVTGLVRGPEEDAERLFPLANLAVVHGCADKPEAPVHVHYCPQCRDARRSHIERAPGQSSNR
jgi:hypothetical protein